MSIIDIKEYTEIIKKERKNWFLQPYDLVYEQFEKENFHLEDTEFFMKNASMIIETLLEKCCESFYPLEKEFTNTMLQKLVSNSYINSLNGLDAITWFIENYPEHIYKLTLSNTQNRRSRARKEFASIIEMVLIGANISMDSQGNIGKQVFVDTCLGKSVDIVFPGAIEYTLDKRNIVLISVKTTLREGWQEILEEMGRTEAREMFLATLDESISSEVIQNLCNANIQIVTTKRNKQNNYSTFNSVLAFEDLMVILDLNESLWSNFSFEKKDRDNIKALLEKQLSRHKNHSFIKRYYQSRIEGLK